MNKFYNGALDTACFRFIERHDISDEEMNELMEILEKKKKEETGYAEWYIRKRVPGFRQGILVIIAIFCSRSCSGTS